MKALVALVVAVGLGSAGRAAAQSNPEAERAFRDGKELMTMKQYAQACDAFAASDRLEPNVSTRFRLADCQEQRGRLASAWGLFLAVAAASRDNATHVSLRESATRRAAALEPRLPYLTVSVADASRVEGLTITRNDEPIDAGMWNRALPIDAGTYVVRAAAPGREPWSTTITVDGESQRHTVDVPRFELALPPAVGSSDGEEDEAVPPPSRRRRWLVPAVLGGAAVLAGGLALGFELSGRATYDDYEVAPERDELLERANRKHHVAQGLAVGAGGAAMAAVLVLVLRRDPTGSSAVSLAPFATTSDAGVVVGGRF